MEIRQLLYFLAVAEELNFRRAADRVHITQPALSRQIAQLEEEIGCALLIRTSRKVELTTAGRTFFERATKIVGDIDRAKLATQSAQINQIGPITVGYIPSASSVIVPQALRHFRNAYPGVAMDLRGMLSQNQFDALLARRIDIGILRPWRRIKGLTMRPIVSEPFVVAMPQNHPLAGQTNLPLQAFKHDHFIMHAMRIPGISLTYDVIGRMFDDAGFTPHIALESPEHMDLALGLVNAGFGLSIVPQSMMLNHVRGIAFAQLQDQKHRSEIFLAWRDEHETADFEALANKIANSFHEPCNKVQNASSIDQCPNNIARTPKCN